MLYVLVLLAAVVVTASNTTVDRLQISLSSTHARLHAGYFGNYDAVDTVEIYCDFDNDTLLSISDDAFDDIKDNLLRLLFEGCSMEKIPAAVRQLTTLRSLDVLSSINRIEAQDFIDLHDLETLTLTISPIIKGDSVEQLPVLEGLVKLKELHLFNIKYLGAKTFIMPQLESLIFHGPALTDIDIDAFEGLRKLHHLDLPLNEWKPELLEPLPSLTFLSLESGNLEQLPEDSFAYAPNLTHIGLRDNKLSSISTTLFEPVPDLEWLDLSHNHWICDDKMGKLIAWIKKQIEQAEPHFLIHPIYCAEPPQLMGADVMKLDMDLFKPWMANQEDTDGTTAVVEIGNEEEQESLDDNTVVAVVLGASLFVIILINICILVGLVWFFCF